MLLQIEVTFILAYYLHSKFSAQFAYHVTAFVEQYFAKMWEGLK